MISLKWKSLNILNADIGGIFVGYILKDYSSISNSFL